MNVLWIPIFSMRSYETGKYAALKDGNFQLTMARVLASDFYHITVAIPADISDEHELLSKFKRELRIEGKFITFEKFHYGANAVETREKFWDLNRDRLTADIGLYQKYDLVISDITRFDLDVFAGPPIVYNFNITKLPELDRPYIDRFFDLDLESIERSLFTTVLNPRQREYILEVRPDLIDKVIVNTKCAHTDLLPKSAALLPDPKMIFWPFRISDKAYKFAEFMEAFESQGLHEDGWHVVITDPNDTIAVTRGYISKIKPSKEEYYRILGTRPVIVMLDDIDTVLHPGTIEFFHYGCPVITYSSDLILNTNTIPDLRWLRNELQDLEYNEVDMTSFVYSKGETDSLYNKDFVNVRSN